jgi:hypothetical protein
MRNRTHRTRGAIGRPVAAGAVLGVVAGLGTYAVVSDHGHDAHAVSGNDRLAAAVAELKRTHLFIGPEDRWRFADAQVSAIEHQLARQKVPTYLIYWNGDDGDNGFTFDGAALDWIKHEIGAKGYYLSIDSGTGGYAHGEAIGYAPTASGDLEDPARPGDSIVPLLQEIDDEDPEPPWEDEPSVIGPLVGGIALGLLGSAVLAGLVSAAGRLRRRRA